MNDIFDEPDDAATPLTDSEKHDLKLDYISNRDQLNAAEQENIVRGQEWALGRKRSWLAENAVRSLHRHMFDDVWRWAGKFRISERNLGIDHWKIPEALHMLLGDAVAWIETKAYAPDEIAVRLHHRLTQIHPFPNGNGRHARLLADLLVMQSGQARFTWGSANLRNKGNARALYIAALRAADNHEIEALMKFARS